MSVPPPLATFDLTDEQHAAVDAAATLTHKVFALSGAAGTGKTTLVRALLVALRGRYVVLCAPTNKAAKVLRAKTGVPATTVHRAFFVPDRCRVMVMAKGVYPREPKLNVFGEPIFRTRLRFEPRSEQAAEWDRAHPDEAGDENPKRPKFTRPDVTIIDEASMLPAWILEQVVEDSCRVILIGDAAQLPPVKDNREPAGAFASRPHHATLHTVLRQGEGSRILALATAIRGNGSAWPPQCGRDRGIFEPTMTFDDLLLDIENLPQFVTFTNRVRASINTRVRARLGYAGTLPRKGETLVVNGDGGTPTLPDGSPGAALTNGDEIVLIADAQPMPDGREDLFAVVFDGGMLIADAVGFLAIEVPARDHAYDSLRERAAQARADDDDAAAARADAMATDGGGDERIRPTVSGLQFAYARTCHKSQGSEWSQVVVIDERGSAFGVQMGAREELRNEIELLARLRHPEARDDCARKRAQLDKELSPQMYACRWFYTAVTRARKDLIVAPVAWANDNVPATVAAGTNNDWF